ncbi:hypothetical protein C2845_PM07G14390 [Panicum miliaceum]|uniref:Uncharacterized protein n=1 Tax=Panicum miliaceum TaxID=4540 RepID=A0A3L6SP83_PANMI|nr:hypothetical protein C2845_PM07G14390 [Panicum miliaceum]
MAGEVPAAAATAAPPASELAWSPSTTIDADIEALVAQGLLPEKAISGWRSCFREAFPTEDRTETGGKYPETSFKDTNKRWAEEWFVDTHFATVGPLAKCIMGQVNM